MFCSFFPESKCMLGGIHRVSEKSRTCMAGIQACMTSSLYAGENNGFHSAYFFILNRRFHTPKN